MPGAHMVVFILSLFVSGDLVALPGYYFSNDKCLAAASSYIHYSAVCQPAILVTIT